ncbi:hypothetical protein [Microcoleus sp. T3_D1]|uniref:hypothetical protein n=1 Tax=Microcoleus sp. T3_D1 TaxID=3055427 RepID=UPI002FCFFF97
MTENLRTALLNKYHIGDSEIYESRLRKFSWVDNLDLDDINLTVQGLEKSVPVIRKYDTIPQEFIRKIIAFDNRDAYFILRTFIGISGFVLRSKILEYLNKAKILKNEGEIYSYNDQDIIAGLYHFKEYRKSVLRKNVSGYIQTDYTCTAVCLMMVLNYYGIVPSSPNVEQKLHSLSCSKYTSGEHYSGVVLNK